MLALSAAELIGPTSISYRPTPGVQTLATLPLIPLLTLFHQKRTKCVLQKSCTKKLRVFQLLSNKKFLSSQESMYRIFRNFNPIWDQRLMLDIMVRLRIYSKTGAVFYENSNTVSYSEK